MEVKKPNIDESWYQVLRPQFEAPYFADLKSFLVSEKRQYAVYPPGPLIFNAFNLTPFDKVKVVILGQDPYHGPGQAHGLSFSVPDGVPFPPSLQNIFKELHDDLGVPMARSGNLEKWAREGVLLLNASLTVRAGQAASHSRHGWEQFTDARLGTVHRRRHPRPVGATRAPRLHPLGQLRHRQAGLDRPLQTPDPEVGAPLAALRQPRLLRVSSFFANEQLFDTKRNRTY